ncbi:MAG: GIY-YIG nuclease family protein [Oscillospiraceae bacterium]|nr:GIY-YIG nuclease family protein [Oscillospiraceae bacterium]
MYYVYMVRCSDGSHYTGLARYLCKRMREHTERSAACAKYTRTHHVVSLDGLWQTETRSDAARLEALLKTLTKPQKLALLHEPQNLAAYFFDKLDASVYEALPNVTLEECTSGRFEET